MIKISGNRRVFRNRKLGSLPKVRVSQARAAQKKTVMLKKIHNEPIMSTVMKSGLKGVRLMKLSTVMKNHREGVFEAMNPPKKNWFMRFLDRARQTLHDPNNEIMVAIRVRLAYDYLSNVRVEEYYDDRFKQLPTQ